MSAAKADIFELLTDRCNHHWTAYHYSVFSVRYMSSSVGLSSVTFVRPTQGIEIVGSVLRHLVPWPSVSFR